MGVPLVQQYRVGRYILGQKLKRNTHYPLVLMLEPLFRCNLSCAGCGKIEHPAEILDKALTVDECLAADRKSTRLNSSHSQQSRMPSSA